MTPRTALVLAGTLVALLAASVFFVAQRPPAEDPLALHADGIGPLRLGRDYREAAALAQRQNPDTAFVGSGCGGLDEIRYSGRLGDLPVGIMAMADQGVLIEVEAAIEAPLQAESEAACLAMRDRLAAIFIPRFGPLERTWTVRKPVSREHMATTGPVVLVARWFPTGGSCYVSAHYGLRPEEPSDARRGDALPAQ
jgi:hypothetical protein